MAKQTTPRIELRQDGWKRFEVAVTVAATAGAKRSSTPTTKGTPRAKSGGLPSRERRIPSLARDGLYSISSLAEIREMLPAHSPESEELSPLQPTDGQSPSAAETSP
jgi:hypothetical protein